MPENSASNQSHAVVPVPTASIQHGLKNNLRTTGRTHFVIAARRGTIPAVGRAVRSIPGRRSPSPTALQRRRIDDDRRRQRYGLTVSRDERAALRIENPHALLVAIARSTVPAPGMTVAPMLLMLPLPALGTMS